MPTLNRFPLLALWAKEAARRIGYTVHESEALGHAYAVLYAIRAASKPKKKADGAPAAAAAPSAAPPPDQVEFGGDKISVAHDDTGHVQGFVGGDLQTSHSYRSHVIHKYPDDYYAKLEKAFRKVFRTLKPKELNSRLLYDLYDGWKKSCGVGRLVDLDKLLAWCDKRARASG